MEVIRIDDLRLNRCDLIKVDVEGMECDVLEGSRETIAKHRPVLFIENNTLERSSATIGLIDSLDYDAYRLRDPRFRSTTCFEPVGNGNSQSFGLESHPQTRRIS